MGSYDAIIADFEVGKRTLDAYDATHTALWSLYEASDRDADERDAYDCAYARLVCYYSSLPDSAT